MTDEEFQSLLDGVNRMKEETAEMAEGLDLASEAVGGGEASGIAGLSEDVVHQSVAEADERQTEEEVPESMTPQPGVREGDEQTEERDAEVPAEEPESMTSQPGARKGDELAQEKDAKIPAEEPESVAPPVSKPNAVKRRLILKNDPKAERQKPKRVSQRCLGRGMSRKAGANTASDAVEISSEDERATPTKPGEESLSATNQEDTSTAIGMISPTPDDQKEETAEMAEGLDLASKAVGMDIPIDDDTIVYVITKPATQKEPSTSAGKKPEKDEEEERYLQERKRKGKAPAKRKQSNKKPRTVNTGIVIREPERREPLHQREASDSKYTSSDEPDSESDVSLEEEEFHEQQLPENHRELVHPTVERLEYRCWRVELTDELMEDMKHYSTKKLQDAFDDKEDNSKQVKCGKVLHIPSLTELSVRDSFLSSVRALGFDWLLENRDPEISMRLAKEFFTTFRFQVTTDLDEVSISFRVFGRELSMSVIEWTVRLGMCSLDEAIGPEWRSRERGIPRRHVDFMKGLAAEAYINRLHNNPDLFSRLFR